MNLKIDKLEILQLEKQLIIDWYDGIVTALVTFVGKQPWCLIELLAWDPDLQQKIFSLSVLTDQQAAWFLKTIDEMSELKSSGQANGATDKFCILKDFKGLDIDDNLFTEQYVFKVDNNIMEGVRGLRKPPHPIVRAKGIEEIVAENNSANVQFWDNFFK